MYAREIEREHAATLPTGAETQLLGHLELVYKAQANETRAIGSSSRRQQQTAAAAPAPGEAASTKSAQLLLLKVKIVRAAFKNSLTGQCGECVISLPLPFYSFRICAKCLRGVATWLPESIQMTESDEIVLFVIRAQWSNTAPILYLA